MKPPLDGKRKLLLLDVNMMYDSFLARSMSVHTADAPVTCLMRLSRFCGSSAQRVTRRMPRDFGPASADSDRECETSDERRKSKRRGLQYTGIFAQQWQHFRCNHDGPHRKLLIQPGSTEATEAAKSTLPARPKQQ